LGEHSVIREHPALVFPLISRSLCLSYTPRAGIEAIPPAPWRTPFQIAMERLKDFLRQHGQVFSIPPGEIEISSDLPMAAGLGSSAALAVALARLAIHLEQMDEKLLFRASLAIEDGFHGKSSGMDIAAVIAKAPLLFQRGIEPKPFKPAWHPNIYLCDSGERSSTSASVAKVESIRQFDPKKFFALDQIMAEAVADAKIALANDDEKSFERLALAMEKGARCFREWQLISPKIDDKFRLLSRAGARAMKPTGSGGGGFILSLWKEKPANIFLEDNKTQLISAF
jgi:mevalonate kinase